MAALFDEGSSDEEGNLKINTNYADKYNQWREKEEYQKLKDKYGESGAMRMMANGDESSSTSESEDEDGEAWDSEVEKQFFQTLASLKKKDPSIYNTEKQFFDKTAQPAPPKKSTKEDAFTLRDYERKLILEKGGKMSDDEDAPPRTFHEEQEQLKIGFKAALQDSDSETEDLFQIRPKTNAQKEKEEEEYKEWLKGRKEDINNEETKKQLEPLKEYWSNPKLDENESFLKDFFLNKRYKCSEDKNYIPTYDEVVHESEGDLSEDEKILEKQLEFEHKYNFRFEEPDPEFIKRYPRTIADSMRRPDTSRKAKRDEVKERKKQEKQEKKEELKMLKKYKLKEIQEKLEQLKSITGNASLPFQDDDLQGDFDPEQYDKKMGEIFNQDYYHVNDEDQKPEFPYDPEIDDENWDDYKGQQAYPSTSGENYNDDYDGPHCEDPDFNMDCDYEDAKEESKREIIDMTRRNRGRKKSIFAQKLETKKPVFDPQQYPNYEEYLEEYYKLDYEDIIGDQPVRFKYRTVVENDFGLDIEEILVAREKELNQWCSVKKMSQKGFCHQFLLSKDENPEPQQIHESKKKKKNKKKKNKNLTANGKKNVDEIMCSVCETKQPVQQNCSNCGILFGQYFCGKCKLIDDEDKKQYHCEGCVCRKDEQNKLPYLSGGHPHIKDSFSYTIMWSFDSSNMFQFIHSPWPLCLPSLSKIHDANGINEEIASTPMPVEYQNFFVTILCNDCHQFSEVPMHPLGAKCQNAPCGSYNTCRSGGPVNRPVVREQTPNSE
nr:EOG090X05XL [Daphnia magna]